MHTDHKFKEEGILTMVCSGGLFVMGKLIGGNKLIDPRVFSIIDNGQRMQLAPLPAAPPFIIIGPDGFRYPLPESDKTLRELYIRVTTPAPSIITLGNEAGNVVKMQ